MRAEHGVGAGPGPHEFVGRLDRDCEVCRQPDRATIHRTREQAKLSALAALRQATWEATQFLSYDELREYVEAVLREVESDEP